MSHSDEKDRKQALTLYEESYRAGYAEAIFVWDSFMKRESSY